MISSSSILFRHLRMTSTTSVRSFSASKDLVVGFIGLGNMGGNMAANLIKSNIAKRVVIYDIVEENVKRVLSTNATNASAVTNVADIAKDCNVIITMVPATKHVSDLLLGSDSSASGLFQNAQKNTMFIDCSTIDPIASKDLQHEASKRRLRMIDAPVSGGVTGAAAGTLTFMVGGSDADVDFARPILMTMGKNVVHCGGPGNGGVTKLCNNLALAISMIGTSEAMSLGVRLGMDPHKLAQVMNTSTARCWSSDTYNPVPGVIPGVPSSREYAGGFGSALMEKDLTLAMNAASAVKARLPLGSSAHQLYGLLCEHGYGNKDFSVVYDYLSKSVKK